MNYLIDTCVLSECVKKTPNPLLLQQPPKLILHI